MSSTTTSRAPRAFMLTSCLGRGGAERVTVNVANHLEELGWNVTILPFQPEIDEYSVNASVTVDRGMPQGGSAVLRGLQKQRHIMQSIRRARPDVVVSLDAGLDHLALSRFVQNYDLVSSVVTDPAWMFDVGRVKRILLRRALRKSSRIIFQSNGAMQFFEPAIRAKGVIIDNPLVDGLVHNDTPFEERKKEVVTFGRMIPVKRLDVLVRAFAEFHVAFPDYTLTLIGRGPEKDATVALAQELGIAASVNFEDFRTDVHERIRDSAMYVSSSDIEGVSNAMLEAMALGLPCACTDASPGGTREIIERFETGVLADKGDSASLAKAMSAIAGDANRANQMIRNGSRLVQELDTTVVNGKWVDVFESVIANKPAHH